MAACLWTVGGNVRTTHLEDGDPGVSDVVEADGPVVRVLLTGPAVAVERIPVDAPGPGGVWGGEGRGLLTVSPALPASGDAGAA